MVFCGGRALCCHRSRIDHPEPDLTRAVNLITPIRTYMKDYLQLVRLYRALLQTAMGGNDCIQALPTLGLSLGGCSSTSHKRMGGSLVADCRQVP